MDDLVIQRGVTIPGAELELAAARSGGPGGQHVNKTESKVEVRWRPANSAALSDAQRARLLSRLEARLTNDGELIVTASDHRSQHRNREVALERLAALVREALTPVRKRVPTRPGRAARERRIQEKKARGEKKKRRRWRGED